MTETNGVTRTQSPMVVVHADELRIEAALERVIVGWAGQVGAPALRFPPLLPVEALSRFDYFQNFPHLMLLAAPLDADRVRAQYVEATEVREVPGEHLTNAVYALPSAACYGTYLHLENETLAAPTRITTVATCFRNETKFEGMRRLLAFRMREIVCVGDVAAVQAHIKDFKVRITAFAGAVGLPLTVAAATDPFFDPSASRAVMQKLFPVKEEFVYGGSLAIASVNFHRNFFGERFGIRLADGPFAFSSCVAFGLERWIWALKDHFAGDVERIVSAIERAGHVGA
jgi:seryl-tRNA synthetase